MTSRGYGSSIWKLMSETDCSRKDERMKVV